MATEKDGTLRLPISGRVDSFVEILEAVQGWTADFRQLDRELFPSDVFQTQLGSTLVTGGHFGCSVNQKGCQPSGVRCFAIQEENCPEMLWYGHTVGPNSLLSFPTIGEVDVLSKPGFNVTVFSVPEPLLESYFERNLRQPLQAALGPDEKIFHALPEQLKTLRRLCHAIKTSISPDGPDCGGLLRQRYFEDQILESLMGIVFPAKPGPLIDSGWKNRKLSYLLDVMNSQVEGDMRLSDIYALSGLPERTAQHLFRQELGMTPNAYLKGQRLFATHRALWQADAQNTTVSDIANQFGFWHMGQFAHDYRSIFGVNPSGTLAKNGKQWGRIYFSMS